MSLDLYLLVNYCDGCKRGDEVMDKNITHNLAPMWREAGCYDALYESDGKRARDVYDAIDLAVEAMEADQERFARHNSPNGWGTYKHALPWLQEVRRAFRDHPNAVIKVSR